MMSDLPETRRLKIIDLLNHSPGGMITISQLSHDLGVSEMTVRRDLDLLEQFSIVTRVHGGAVICRIQQEKSFNDRLEDANAQKKAIGWAAAQLVQDGDRIILDAGTTTQQIASNLVHKNNITIITNNIHIIAEMAKYPHIQVIILGGVLKHKEGCSIGHTVRQQLEAFTSVDKLFLSAAGFSIKEGATDIDFYEVEIKQAMIRSAREVILSIDSGKWERVELLRTATLSQINTVVTDDGFPEEAIIKLEEQGVKVVTPTRQTDHLVSVGHSVST